METGQYRIAVMSSDLELNSRIQQLCAKYNNYFIPHFFSNKLDALDFLKYDLPEINIINFADAKINHSEIIQAIQEDPWLHYGGIIIIHRTSDTKSVMQFVRKVNVINTIARKNFVRDFYRLQKILIQNRQLLFQRDLQQNLIRSITGSFVMDNDPFNVKIYSTLVPNYLYNIGYIDYEIQDRFKIILFELLMNSIEHGNCNITYEEKTNWLEKHGDILELIRKKNTIPEIQSRRVKFSYTITPELSRYTISDDGDGFEWKKQIQSETDTFELHGRGIKMAKFYTTNLKYNEKGNEVSFELCHNSQSPSIIPAIFRDQKITTFKDGEIIFKEGDNSNYMYYIVSGNLRIYQKNIQIAQLSKDDLFLGEMSFLLSNKRSATVKSNGESQLILVSKKTIVNSLQVRPHYGILLSRLLARRLQRMNEYTSSLKLSILEKHPNLHSFFSKLESNF